MKKRIITLILAASAGIMINNSQEIKVLADENNNTDNIVESNEIAKNEVRSQQKGQVVNVSTSLRIRSGAGTNYSVVGQLGPSAIVNVEGKSGSWYKIEYKGVRGYVHGDYLKVTNSNNDSNNNNSNNNSGQVQGKKGQTQNVSTSLRIRSAASTSASVLGAIYPNQTFDITGEQGSWYKISINGINGYVHKDYVKVLSGNSTPSTPETPNKPETPSVTPDSGKGQVYNVTTSLRFRSAPSTSSSVIGYLYPGNTFDIKGKSGDWYYISFGGKTGYIHGDYVKKINSNTESNNSNTSKPETPSVTPDSGKGQVYNVSTNLRFRSAPNTSSSVIGYLSAGDIVDIKGKSGDWYYISFGGKTGYVHGDYIKRVNNSTGGSNNSGSNTGTTTNKYQEVLAVMKAHLGTPYIYGGSGELITTQSLQSLKNRFPNNANRGDYNIDSKYINSGYRAFDCSGLMQWGFRQVGISLGRTTYDQIKNGVEVSKSNVKPGDLLFYSNMGHVGMYIGNDQWIESPKPGAKVRISNVPWSSIGRARRVIN